MLNNLSLLSFPSTLQQREEVLTTRMLRFASEQRDEVRPGHKSSGLISFKMVAPAQGALGGYVPLLLRPA